VCTVDSECLNGLILFEACHIEYQDDVQVIGRCVQDTYDKGFGVAAIVLGSLGVFGVLIAVGLAVFSIVNK